MTVYTEALINNTYELVLPDFRKVFHADRPNWERGRLESCYELMKPGMTVFDIGAEHGDFTTLYHQWVGQEGKVIPVEPAAHYWEFIRMTFAANGFDKPQRSWVALVGDRPTRRLRGDVEGWPNEAYGEGIPDGGFVHLAQDDRLPRTTIDAMSSFVHPNAIVIDIEGAEWHALVGAKQTMRNLRPLIWVSVHDDTMMNWYGKSMDDILTLCKQVDYFATELPHHGEGETFWLLQPR